MPRRNRVERAPDAALRLPAGPRVETRRGRSWNVRDIPAAAALKPYVCPGCGNRVAEGTAHVVVWRADGVQGDAADLEARRHWHVHCWRVA